MIISFRFILTNIDRPGAELTESVIKKAAEYAKKFNNYGTYQFNECLQGTSVGTNVVGKALSLWGNVPGSNGASSLHFAHGNIRGELLEVQSEILRWCISQHKHSLIGNTSDSRVYCVDRKRAGEKMNTNSSREQ